MRALSLLLLLLSGCAAPPVIEAVREEDGVTELIFEDPEVGDERRMRLEVKAAEGVEAIRLRPLGGDDWELSWRGAGGATHRELIEVELGSERRLVLQPSGQARR